jgi:hypothetical protein
MIVATPAGNRSNSRLNAAAAQRFPRGVFRTGAGRRKHAVFSSVVVTDESLCAADDVTI